MLAKSKNITTPGTDRISKELIRYDPDGLKEQLEKITANVWINNKLQKLQK